MNIILLLIFNCLYIFGFHKATQYNDVNGKADPNDREVLWWLRYYLRNAPNGLKKPLFGCVVCMASIHSWVFWVFNEFNLTSLCIYIIYIFALSGLNSFVNDRLSA